MPTANPDGSPLMPGAAYPSPHGWPALPDGVAGLDGARCYGSDKHATGDACYIDVGSIAWRRWLALSTPKKVIGAGARSDRGGVASVLDVFLIPDEVPALSSEADAVRAVTGMSDPTPAMPTEYANDPVAGVVPVGEPIDNCTTCRLWNFPARMVAKLLPAGPVSEPVAMGLRWLPLAFWGGIAWWIWRKARA